MSDWVFVPNIFPQFTLTLHILQIKSFLLAFFIHTHDVTTGLSNFCLAVVYMTYGTYIGLLSLNRQVIQCVGELLPSSVLHALFYPAKSLGNSSDV